MDPEEILKVFRKTLIDAFKEDMSCTSKDDSSLKCTNYDRDIREVENELEKKAQTASLNPCVAMSIANALLTRLRTYEGGYYPRVCMAGFCFGTPHRSRIRGRMTALEALVQKTYAPDCPSYQEQQIRIEEQKLKARHEIEMQELLERQTTARRILEYGQNTKSEELKHQHAEKMENLQHQHAMEIEKTKHDNEADLQKLREAAYIRLKAKSTDSAHDDSTHISQPK